MMMMMMTRLLLASQKIPIQCTMTASRQWGVGTPEGVEATVFAHRTIEEMFEVDELPAAVAVVQ
eukprot:12411989-Karenia_brevis.AAC.1